MEIKVTVHNGNDNDFLNNLLTMEDLGEMLAQRMVERIKSNPIEFTNEMRNNDVINDKEYKEMIINIRKNNIEEDFK